MADEQWYYVQAGQRLGPVPIETLKALISAGSVQPSDLVWADGMADWAPASTFKVLVVAAMPAQATRPQYQQPQHPQQQFQQPQYQQPQYQQPMNAPGYGPAQPALNYYSPPNAGIRGYAGFWLRFVAAVIDGFIVGIIAWVLMFALGAVFFGAAITSSHGSGFDPAMIAIGYLVMYAVAIGINWIYFAAMESSSGQGTLGKRAMGIRVTDEMGQRISFARASGRFFGKLISGFMLIGYLMAAFTQKKQALHDIMAGCLVVV